TRDAEGNHRCIEAGAFQNGHTVSEYHAYYLAFGRTRFAHDTLRLAHLPKTDHPLSRLSTYRDAIKADPRCANVRIRRLFASRWLRWPHLHITRHEPQGAQASPPATGPASSA